VSKSIAKAQKKVEAYHFDIRKNLLEYDGVMNEQRTIVYDQRQSILEGAGLSMMVQGMMEQVSSSQVNRYLSQETVQGSVEADGEVIEAYDPVAELSNWASSVYGIDGDFQLDAGRSQRDHGEEFSDTILAAYQERYAARTEANGEENMQRAERFILLMELDDKWKDHLHAMDTLRHAIGLRGYAQIDPKVAYKREGYEMFSEMLDNFRASVTQLILRVQVGEEDEGELDSGLDDAEFQHSGLAPGTQPESPMQEASDPSAQAPVKTIVNKAPKVGRNDPCLCGSGKKFKKCCGS
jgi:preprotein translocase subunit SecA